MNTKKKIITSSVLIATLLLGFTLGITWNDLPLIKFNPEIKSYEIINILLTLVIGISIPLLVKKWIEDNRSVKTTLVDEVKNIINTLDKIKTLISNCHSSINISKENKDEINYLFHKSELQINSLDEQLKISFDKKSNKIMGTLKAKYNAYKDYLTDGELMLSSFTKIDDRFYREHNTEQAKIETHLKTVIHEIYKL